MLKEQKGITLVALVITIIVLLILAGVSISLVVGNEGVLTRASGAVITNQAGQGKENIELAFGSVEIDYQNAWAGNTALGRSTFYTLDNANAVLTGGYKMTMATSLQTGTTDANGNAVTAPTVDSVASNNSLLDKTVLVSYTVGDYVAGAETFYYTVTVGEKGGATATFVGYYSAE